MDVKEYFLKEAFDRSDRCKMKWYHNNLMKVLQRAKEARARGIDKQIIVAKELMKVMEEKVSPPPEVPLREVPISEDDSLMKPIDPELVASFYADKEKGGDVRYLTQRYKLPPEDRFFFRIQSSWDYGWQQKMSRLRPRDVNRGRCAILKHTFYRKNNLGPDPPHYAQPSGGEVSICSEYSCNF